MKAKFTSKFSILFTLFIGVPALFACDDFTCDSAVVAEIFELNDIQGVTVNAVVNPLVSGEPVRRVKSLYLDNRDITMLPKTMGNLSELQDLNINGNKLTELPPSLISNPPIRLGISGNRFCELSEEMVTFLDVHNKTRNDWRAHQRMSDDKYCDGVEVCTSLECELDVVRKILSENGINEDEVEFSYIDGVDLDYTGKEIATVFDNHVTHLKLNGLGLTTLSNEIRKLEHVKILWLNDNNIEEIPSALLYYGFKVPADLYPTLFSKTLKVNNNRLCNISMQEENWFNENAFVETGAKTNEEAVSQGSNEISWLESQTSDGSTGCDVEVSTTPFEDPFILKPDNVSVLQNNNSTIHVSDLGDHLAITLPHQFKNTHFELIDLKGKVVWQNTTSQNFTLAKKAHFNGVMFLKVSSDSFHSTKKLVFQ